VPGGQKGHYVTLSHCWGNVSERLVTNKANYQQHLQEISFENLARTFQDAIIVTRQLGVRFLWIDCLCIIQDSSEDWQRECPKMGQIYRDSLVTIAGPGAADSSAGFLHERQHWKFQPARFELSCLMGDGESIGDVCLAYHGCDAFPIHPLESDSPLEKRGWIFQERILSQRILYFGSRKMYFECCTNFRHEDSHVPCIEGLSRTRLKKEPLTKLENISYWDWQSILRTYTAARLTKPTDKLPALSGLVSTAQPNLGNRYLAGIWESQILTGLGWYIEDTDLKSTVASLDSGYIAPSWSWASVKSPISTFPIREVIQPLGNALAILDVQVELAGHDPFGELRSGYIKAQGKLKMGMIRNILPETLSICTDGPMEFSETNFIATYYPDDPEMTLFPHFPARRQRRIRMPDLSMFERRVSILLLGSIESLPTADVPPSEGWLGLAIEPVPGTENSYRRIGIAEGLFSQFSAARTWFDDSEEIIVEII
jgi:Heterokaryon incompatibility protein (HET)